MTKHISHIPSHQVTKATKLTPDTNLAAVSGAELGKPVAADIQDVVRRRPARGPVQRTPVDAGVAWRGGAGRGAADDDLEECALATSVSAI
ncbi:hypothetical protein SAMD00023353_1302430 [Rosellinia necatrix]|uniref:Uncharacterized protein n=1 Tax=Rosellinia necatrix TaxID=77044 RepID=A0A1S8A7V2_ROSNE|nr:hypothetical protein SAMD00023353_1302430 [Rosellinia necatrix]